MSGARGASRDFVLRWRPARNGDTVDECRDKERRPVREYVEIHVHPHRRRHHAAACSESTTVRHCAMITPGFPRRRTKLVFVMRPWSNRSPSSRRNMRWPMGMPRFTQADAARLPRQERAGLSLHLSQKLAGLLGGQITVQSVVGQRSTLHDQAVSRILSSTITANIGASIRAAPRRRVRTRIAYDSYSVCQHWCLPCPCWQSHPPAH